MFNDRRARLIALMLVLVLASVAFGQGFGTPSSTFGESQTEREFTSTEVATSNTNTAYFQHDQLLKLLLVLGFTLAALAIVWTRRFSLRRWLLLASIVVLGFLVGGLLCPIAAVQNIVLKISSGYLLLFLVPTLVALFVGRLFCGYVCPFGALQEWLHVKRLRLSIPSRWMRVLRWIPYGLLVYLVVRVFATSILTWPDTTPFKAFFTWGGTPASLIVSGVFALLSVFIFRPFCRLFCPLGAWFAILSRISPFRIRESANCVSCSRCEPACASGVIAKGKAHSEDCFLCGECIRVCPTTALHVCRKPTRESRR